MPDTVALANLYSEIFFMTVTPLLKQHTHFLFFIFLPLLMFVAIDVQAGQLTLSGNARMGAEDLNLVMNLSNAQEFMTHISGYQSYQTGYDGESFWRIDNGTGPFEVDFTEKEVWILIHWMLSGYWLDTSAPIIWSADPKTGNAQLQLATGRVKMQITTRLETIKALQNGTDIDDHSSLPKWMKAINLPQEVSVSFVGEQQLAHARLPKKIIIEGIGEVESFVIHSAQTEQLKTKNIYSKPKLQRLNTSYNFKIGSEIEVKQATSGHLFVKPSINGEQLGWFLFDSGAGGSQLAQSLIDKFNLKRVARSITGGIGGTTGFTDVFQGGQLSLGPLTINNLNYKSYDPARSMASKVLGEAVVGVLGWDVLSRATVEVDMLKGRIWIHNTSDYRIAKKYRERLFLHWKVPYVEALFPPNNKGIFMLDTGAGSNGIFFTDFSVRTYDMLAGNTNKPSEARGAGGRLPIIKGELEWFEVGGYRSTNAPAVYSIAEDYEADIFSTGFLGGAVIKPYRVVFDYLRNEVGFIPRNN